MKAWISSRRIVSLTIAVGLIVATQKPALAFDQYVVIKKRCQEEGLDTATARGRNAWARKCKLLSVEEENFYNARKKYPTFEGPFANGTAPTSENAPCLPDGSTVVDAGVCTVAGCYTPTQRVLFASGYTPIREGVASNLNTVLTPASGWVAADGVKQMRREKIGAYTVGEELGEVLTITSTNGHRIQVTSQHPLVTAQGEIIKARDVIAQSTSLLTVEGPSLVASVAYSPYAGLVYNVEPESTRTLANIIFAEGFLNGSVRYQNEWVEDSFRLSLRDKIDISAF